MKLVRNALLVLTMVAAQHAFAADDSLISDDDQGNKPCASIAKACAQAGYERMHNADKKFWKDCMKPVILGKKVEKVDIDSTTVQACRNYKIVELKAQLQEFENAK